MDEGGVEFARSVLEKTVGAEKADQMLSRVEEKVVMNYLLWRTITSWNFIWKNAFIMCFKI